MNTKWMMFFIITVFGLSGYGYSEVSSIASSEVNRVGEVSIVDADKLSFGFFFQSPFDIAKKNQIQVVKNPPKNFIFKLCPKEVRSATNLPQIIPSKTVLPDSRPNENVVKLVNGVAYAPVHAPEIVKRAVDAGNALQKKPYKFGGGHAKHNDEGYDCSGTVSYVLRNASLMKGSLSSSSFVSYGERGVGKWITIYARSGHVFMTIGGLRLDALGIDQKGAFAGGPRWYTKPRKIEKFQARHPRGL